MSLLRVEQVVKRFDNRVAVDHLNIQIEKGEIYGLLGPNGAGKSTTIQMITGLLPIDSGDIVLEGKSVKQSPLHTKRKIGIVPQDLAIYEKVSARHNVQYFARLYGLRGKLLQERVDEALERVGLSERQQDLAASFSGGMKRRLNIACAITHRPPLIIMDEPTVGIDPHSRNHILDSVKKLKEDGSTIIYTSHYMEEVSAVSTRIGIMNDGRLIATGTEAELRQQFGTDEKLTIETVEVLDHHGAAAINELQKHPHVRQASLLGNTMELLLKPGEGSLQDILFIMAKHQLSIRSMKREEPNLETLFLTLTGRQLRD
ncbi:ABC transporter ATP-binding protein [Paenibacillus taiwanensis]|uniref:ABC transporter ATP-binding protein n=1 Tax=Paenibacillus taiwanensis TaxID=401638 RepID=UPI000408EA08|nr:ABC transporter ATP-binding protein [Paenibacillus taiwanensis]